MSPNRNRTCAVLAILSASVGAMARHSHMERSSFGRLHSFSESRSFRDALRQGAVLQKSSLGACAMNWTHTTNGYIEACGGASGNVGTFSSLTASEAQAACCSMTPRCVGFSFDPEPSNTTLGGGYYKGAHRVYFVLCYLCQDAALPYQETRTALSCTLPGSRATHRPAQSRRSPRRSLSHPRRPRRWLSTCPWPGPACPRLTHPRTGSLSTARAVSLRRVFGAALAMPRRSRSAPACRPHRRLL